MFLCEQTKRSFLNYRVSGAPNMARNGRLHLRVSDGHVRTLSRLTQGPFRYRRDAATYLRKAHAFTSKPIKQAVIAPSAPSCCITKMVFSGYPQEHFLSDLLDESEREVRKCLEATLASQKIRSRVEGTLMASRELGLV